MADKAREIPPYPDGVTGRGGRFWDEVHETYRLEIDEMLLLTECCRILTTIDGLVSAISRDGVMSTTADGRPIAHPALIALDRQRPILSRLLGMLSLEHADGSVVPTGHQLRSAKANKARWSAPQNGAAVSEAASRAVMIRWHGNDSA